MPQLTLERAVQIVDNAAGRDGSRTMKRFLYLPLCLLATVGQAQEAAAPQAVPEGFQKARWGMGANEVSRLWARSEPAKDPEYRFQVKDEIAWRTAVAAFAFTPKNELYRVHVVFSRVIPEGTLTESCEPQEYAEYRELLSKKYGSSKRNDEVWSKAPKVRNASEWAARIARGELALISEWKTPKTNVVLVCDSSSLSIRYENPPLADAERRRVEQAKLNQL
jgi:hypothetical protein